MCAHIHGVTELRHLRATSTLCRNGVDTFASELRTKFVEASDANSGALIPSRQIPWLRPRVKVHLVLHMLSLIHI